MIAKQLLNQIFLMIYFDDMYYVKFECLLTPSTLI